MNRSSIKALEAGIALSKKNKYGKFISRPFYLVASKILQGISGLSQNGLPVTGKTFWGEPFVAVFPEKVSSFIYRYGFFEENMTRFFMDQLKPGMTFLDIGAHFGYFSLLGATLVGNEGKIFAFEPTPGTFKILMKNVVDKANLTALNRAVYSKASEIEIQDFGLTFSAFNSIYSGKMSAAEKNQVAGQSVQVTAITIDDFIAENKITPDVIKIDAEGAELEILKGMTGLLETGKTIITLEVGDIPDVEGMPTSKAVIEFLLAKGYRCFDYQQGEFQEQPIRDRYEYNNLIFFPVSLVTDHLTR